MTCEAFGYAGKTVVVAGGGGTGMGAAAAALLVEQGAEVTVLDLQESVEGTKFFHTDLSSSARIGEAVEKIGPHVDALFNCQGISGSAPGTKPSTVMAVNFLGVRELTELLLRRIPRGGAVVSISSAGGLSWSKRGTELMSLLATQTMDDGLAWCEGPGADLVGPAFPDSYATSKQALIMWTMQRAATAIADGVRINAISPGSTATAMTPDFPAAGVDFMNYPSGRSSEPVEQAWPMLFLNSPLASYVNGVNVPVDGGNYSARTMEKLAR